MGKQPISNYNDRQLNVGEREQLSTSTTGQAILAII